MPDGPRQPMRSDDTLLLRELHDQHGPALWRFALSLTGGDSDRAQDVVQETLFRAWRNPQVYDTALGSPRAWLYTVARRIVIDEHRSARNRRETVTDRVPEGSVPGPVDDIVNRELLTAAMSRLSPEHRAVLRECYYRGSSVAEAAETLNLPPGTVKSRTHYALRALRLAIDELGGAE